MKLKLTVLAPPTYEKLGIAGKLEEGFPLALTGKYMGGFEGESVIQWYRNNPKLTGEEVHEIEGANQKVGSIFILTYVSVQS